MMMSFVSLGLSACSGPSSVFLAFSTGGPWIGDLSNAFSWRGAGAERNHPARPVHGVSGHVLHHYGRVDFRLDRRTDAFSIYVLFITLWAIR
jgi:hypothetical protein